ncbi:hypothetical protein Agub_g15446, partial [Astrephomene gubernaculifera]
PTPPSPPPPTPSPPSPKPPSPKPPSPPPPIICPFNTTPAGAYNSSCSGCTLSSSCVLTCTSCTRTSGTTVATSLNLQNCNPGWAFTNNDGQLGCSAYGSDLGPATWIYQQNGTAGRQLQVASQASKTYLMIPIAPYAEDWTQIWHVRLIDQANGLHVFHPAASPSLCWDVEGGSQDAGARVLLYSCLESDGVSIGPNRKFKIVQSCVPGEVHIIAYHSNKCLDTNIG